MEKHWTAQIEHRIKSMVCPLGVLRASKKKMDSHNAACVNAVKASGGQLTIVLHGILANYYTTVFPFVQWFKRSGIDVISIGFDYRNDLESAALDVKAQIDAIIDECGATQIHLIGISQGGVVARYYVEALGGKEIVSKLVTVFSPLKEQEAPNYSVPAMMHRFLAKKGASQVSVNQYKTIERSFSVPQLALYGTRDLIIGRLALPTVSSQNVKLVPMSRGHVLICFSIAVMEKTRAYLIGGHIDHV